MIYTIENDELRIGVNSAGAELYSIFDKQSGSERLWQADAAVWPRRAPILFPITGRLKNDTYTLDGKEYHLPLHGFARDFEHSLVEKAPHKLRLRLESTPETKIMYPFDFCFDSVFEIVGNFLSHRLEIYNRSDKDMPFSTGFHTGYICPFDAEHSVEDYSIVFENRETVQRTVTEVGTLLTLGKEAYLSDSDELALFNGMFAPNLCFEHLRSSKLGLLERDSGRSIELDFTGFPTLVLWSAAGNIKFVCIEPWHGSFEPPENYGELFGRPGIISLPPKGQFSCGTKATFNNG